jgi:uncharacterized protein with von Willebrand factor type A (vWA) domain
VKSIGEQHSRLALEFVLPGPDAAPATGGARDADEEPSRLPVQTWSAQEALRRKNFARYSDEEVEQAKAALAALQWQIGERRTRRWRAGGEQGVIDLRRVLRRNLRWGGELLDLPRRRRTVRPRSLVVLCDVSGSMERYTRMLLHFVHSLVGRGDRVEAFLFATRLTRITRQLRRQRIDAAMSEVADTVKDWGGGTRIGDALRQFHVRWARRVLGRGAVVLIVSDGWDRGDPDVLRREIQRLQRSSHRLLWLNPLLGSPDYAPLTRGMQSARPFVDDFLPVHDLASLEALARHLSSLPTRRPARRQGAA